MRFKIQTTVLLFVLLGIVSACNTFKDEITPDSYMEVPKQLDGKWQLKTVIRNGITEITYPIVQGKRHITLTISPGCSSNSYVYSFEKIEE